MKFPDKLTVMIRNHSTGAPANRVAIILVLFASHKNDYYVGPAIAGNDGQAEFTRAECEAAIRRAQEMFVMDYSGDLASCRPFIEVRLHSPESIRTMLQQFKHSPDFWGRGFPNPKRFFADLENVKNADYEDAKVIATEEQLRADSRLELQLIRKSGVKLES